MCIIVGVVNLIDNTKYIKSLNFLIENVVT